MKWVISISFPEGTKLRIYWRLVVGRDNSPSVPADREIWFKNHWPGWKLWSSFLASAIYGYSQFQTENSLESQCDSVCDSVTYWWSSGSNNLINFTHISFETSSILPTFVSYDCLLGNSIFITSDLLWALYKIYRWFAQLDCENVVLHGPGIVLLYHYLVRCQ